MPKTKNKSQTFMIFTNVENHFYHHLLPIAKEAKKRGLKVQVMTNFENLEEKIKELGFETYNIKFSRKSLNPFNALKEIHLIYKTLKKAKPNILMAFTIKPIFFSTITTMFLRSIILLNNFVGLGLLFTDNHPKYKALRSIVSLVLKFATIGRKVVYITQNRDDRQELINSGISTAENTISQCSVGVDLNHFKAMPLPKSKKICFALISRMLIDKGVIEFIEAAKMIKDQGYDAHFLLVGAPDEDNPKSLTQDFLENLNKEGIVEYLGSSKDVREIWKIAHVAVLPSYREGQSRVLLEAAAIGRAVVTTDAPGGRDLVVHNKTGSLVLPRNSKKLSEALINLINKPYNIEVYSKALQHKIAEKFEEKIIANSVLNVFIKNKKKLQNN